MMEKPHIRRAFFIFEGIEMWRCESMRAVGYGVTPKAAFHGWARKSQANCGPSRGRTPQQKFVGAL
jgi:hypothetical protein